MRNIHANPGKEDDIYTGDIKNIQELTSEEERLTALRSENKKKFFKEFSDLLVRVAEQGKITRQTAAYLIAGQMLDEKMMSYSDIQRVIHLASSLELPYEHATEGEDKASYDEVWSKFKKMIYDLKE